jgi:hypothetical protein
MSREPIYGVSYFAVFTNIFLQKFIYSIPELNLCVSK